MYISSLRSLLHLLIIRGDAPIADVVLNSIIKEDGVLRNYTDVGSQGRLLYLRKDNTKKYRMNSTVSLIAEY